MATIKVYMNEKYMLNEEYAKISIEIENIGMFACIYNYRTGKTQVQKYNYALKSKNPANIYGRYKQFTLVTDDNFDNLKKCWSVYPDKAKKAFYCLSFELTRSMRAFFTIFNDTVLNDVMKNEIRKTVNDLKNAIYVCQNDINHGLNSSQENNSITPIFNENDGTWNDIEREKFTGDDYNAMAKVYKADGTPFQYKEYILRLFQSEGTVKLQEWIKKPANARPSIRMAKMKNVNGMSEFITGNFYPIIKEIKFNGNSYYTIKLESGETRNISQYRVDVVDVFSKPPESPITVLEGSAPMSVMG